MAPSHDAGVLVAADGLGSSVRNVVFPEYPKPHFTGLIGTGGITEAPVPDTDGIMRMTFGNNAFFGYLKAEGQSVCWFNSYLGGTGENGKNRRSGRLCKGDPGVASGRPGPQCRDPRTRRPDRAPAIRSTTCRSFLAGTKTGLC
jgi:hypothetical protein